MALHTSTYEKSFSWLQNYTGEPMPVMVYIHGGSFVGGANLWDVGHFLAAQGVVMVVPNYRLGIFGQ